LDEDFELDRKATVDGGASVEEEMRQERDGAEAEGAAGEAGCRDGC
jgi:hypothetical protein